MLNTLPLGIFSTSLSIPYIGIIHTFFYGVNKKSVYFYALYTLRVSAPPQALGGASKPVKPTKLVDLYKKNTHFVHFLHLLSNV